MKVAVITPAFQAEATLGSALASVAAQTRQPDAVIVADDGSTDGTVALARRWQRDLPITVVATGANAGPAAARRLAIESSTSEFIALLDADDAWLPDHLEAMLAAHATTNDGLASADTLAWIPGGPISPRPLSAGAPLPAPEHQLAWLLTENRLSISALFSRARYEAVGGFRTQFRGTEDWDLWIRMVRAGAVVARPDHPTVLYRLSRSGVSSDDAMVQARRAVLDAAEAEGGPNERAALRVGTRHNRAAAHLVDAYGLAAQGRGFAARLAGVRAARGIRPVALRGLAMAVAPRWVAQRRLAVRFDPEVWLRRYGS
jgi:glycosyltransferase involved in cell wall biosynthesis